MSVVVSPSLVVSEPNNGGGGLITNENPIIAWNNIVTTTNLVADTEDPLYPATNLANNATNYKWQALNTAAQYLTLTTGNANQNDHMAIARHNWSSKAIPVSVEGSQEGLVQNLAIFSEDVSNAAYTKEGVTITPNTAQAPDGATTMDTIAAASGNRRVYQTITTVNGTAYTHTWTLKKKVGSTVQLLAINLANAGATFNFDTGLFSAIGSAITATSVVEVIVPGSEYRVSMSWVAIGTSIGPGVGFFNVGDEVYAWGLQLNVGGVAGYVPTGATPVTAYPFKILTPPVILPNDGPAIFRYNPAAYSVLRLKLGVGTAPASAAVAYSGKLLVLQRRIYGGHTPFPMGRVVQVTNGRSEKGEYLGRIVMSEYKTTSITQQNLTAAWYRTYMDPFVEAASRDTPFFFAWRPATYPNEVGYGALTGETPRPRNLDRKRGMMSIDLQVAGIGAAL